MDIHINKNKKITGPSIIKVIILDLVRFLLKKINKPKFFKKNKNRFRFGSVFLKKLVSFNFFYLARFF
jgi:hypothetical protein